MVKMLQPTQWGTLSLSNRIVMAPMCMYQADNHGFIQPFHHAHYTARAYGGVAMVIMEATAVESRGRISDRDVGIYQNEHVSSLKKLVEEVHQSGSLIAIQLAHAGRKSGIQNQSAIAPSAIPFSKDYGTPKAMSLTDIKEVIIAFQDAAKRAQQAGFDGVEIHGAHGYLINEFLSPLSNQRQDVYGGSIENRTRFLKEILIEVRKVFKGEVWVRLSAEEYAEGGHHLPETIQVLKLIQPYIAGVNVSSGGVVPTTILPKPGYQLPFANQIQASGILTIGGGLVTNVDQIEAALDHDCHLIFLGRELLLNPYFVLQQIKKHAPERMLKPYQRG